MLPVMYLYIVASILAIMRYIVAQIVLSAQCSGTGRATRTSTLVWLSLSG